MNDFLHDPDVFGTAALEWLATGRDTVLTIERDDGTQTTDTVSHYIFRGKSSFKGYQIGLLRHIQSPVLDLGCGPGRFLNFLAQHGYQVVGVDISYGVLSVCQTISEKPLNLIQMSINSLGFSGDYFQTILAMGHNMGAVHNLRQLKSTLTHLSLIGRPQAKLLMTSVDVSRLSHEEGDYFQKNIAAGRYYGQERMRLRFGNHVSEWSDWIFIRPEDLGRIAKESGWELIEVLHDENREERFAAVLLNGHH